MGQPVTFRIDLTDEEATIRLGEALAAALPDRYAGWMILLEGDLGAGKSTLARAILKSLGHLGPVPSPTYTLVEPYTFPQGDIYHIDLYRIAGADELEFLGWSELREGFMLIEWPERVPGLAAQADVRITLGYAGPGRFAEFTGLTPRGRELVDRLRLRIPDPVSP